MNLYIADTHFGHDNIIRYCDRPHRSVEDMNTEIFLALLEAEGSGATIYHLGDVAFKPAVTLPELGGLRFPSRHVMIAGNHDRVKKMETKELYYAYFGRIIGHERRWRENHVVVQDELKGQPVRVLLSHAPQQDLRGCQFNLYGHTHNEEIKNPERFRESYPFVFRPGRERKHFCVSAEMVGYRPISLSELLGDR